MAITSLTYQSRHNLDSGNNTPHGATQVGSAVWIANNSDDQVYRYDDSVAYQSKAALPTGNGQPRGLAWIAKHSKVASLDTGTNRVYLISETGTDLSENYPLDSANTGGEGILYFESIDELWVADLTDNKWYRYRYTGAALTFLGTYDMHASNTDARGSCYIPQEQTAACLNASTKELFIYDETGAYVRTLSLNSGQSTPRAITVVGFQLWCLDNGSDDAWLYDLVSDVTLTISTGYPSRYVESIGDNDPADKNDYPIRIDSDVDVSGLTESDVTVTGATVLRFSRTAVRDTREADRGKQFEVVIRPPATGTGTITVAIGANAVTEGNAAVSESFTYTDAVQTTTLFNWDTALPNLLRGVGTGNVADKVRFGCFVDGSRVYLFGSVSGTEKIYVLKRDGTRVPAEDIGSLGIDIPSRTVQTHLSRFRNKFLLAVHFQGTTPLRLDYYRDRQVNLVTGEMQAFDPSAYGITITEFGQVHTQGFGSYTAAVSGDINRWGLFFVSKANKIVAVDWAGDVRQVSLIPLESDNPLSATGERVYEFGNMYRVTSGTEGVLDPLETFAMPSNIGDFDVYGDQLFFAAPLATPNFQSIALPKYRPPAVRSHILPQLLTEGESLPLKYFVDGAEKILFESGYDVPSYLSIDSNQNLVVGTLPTPLDPPLSGGKQIGILVKLRAYSLRGETPFQFYLVINRQQPPVWKPIETLPVVLGETVNLFEFIHPPQPPLSGGSPTIGWKSGFTAPTGYTLTGGNLSIGAGATTSDIELTATDTHGATDKRVSVVVDIGTALVSSERFTRRLEIEGIDVTEDLINTSSIDASLDVLQPYQFVSGAARFLLSSDKGKYDGFVSGNFWERNALNPTGFLNKIRYWVDIHDGGSVRSKLLFEGVINRPVSNINAIQTVLPCIDRTLFLKKSVIGETIGVRKFAVLAKVSETYEGVYTPDASLLPMLTGDSLMVSGSAEIPKRGYKNTPSSNVHARGVYLSDQRASVSGGYLPEDPLLMFKVPYRQRALETFIRVLAESQGFYNPRIDVRSPPPAAFKHLSSRGNLSFQSALTKSVHSVVDWVQDRTTDRFYVLLSHPSAYVRDRLDVYDVAMDKTERRELDYGVRACQLTTADFNNFYIIATDGLQQDPADSLTPVPPLSGGGPRNWDYSYFDALDSSRETEQTRILKYVKNNDTVTTFVDTDDDYPVQIGIHYMAGFENERHIRMCEGIVSEARSQFKVQGSYLYYRYAKWNNFGVARANLSNGTTERLIQVNRDEFYNTLNFDFDVSSNGDVFMVSAEGTASQSTLKVQRWRSGTVITVYQRTDTLAELTLLTPGGNTQAKTPPLSGGQVPEGGAWLGCHEARLHKDRLYCVLPIQRLNDFNGADERSVYISAGAVLACVNLNSREFTVLEHYDYVQLSCRSLTVHENQMVFAESPDASTHFKPSAPDLPNWHSDTRENTVPANKTFLKQVISTPLPPLSGGEGLGTEAMISPWYDGQAFPATPVRMLSDGEALHAIVRYGDRFGIAAPDSDASKARNDQWVTYSADIAYVPDALPRGNAYDGLVEMAKLANARLEVTSNRLHIVDVDAHWAVLAEAFAADRTTHLTYGDMPKTFPGAGYVLIDKEIIRYTAIDTGTQRLSGLTRGVNGTFAVAHTVGADVLFLDKLIRTATLQRPYETISEGMETNKFFNIIQDANDETEIQDSGSISKFGERHLDVSFALTVQQQAWRSYLNAKILERLGHLRGHVEVLLPASYYLDIGDIVAYQGPGDILFPVQITDIHHTETGTGANRRYDTRLILEEIKPVTRLSFGSATVADQTWTQYGAISAFTLPQAVDHKDSYIYRLERLPTGIQFDPETLEVSGEPIFDQTATACRYICVDSKKPTSVAELAFNVTVTRAALAFVDTVSDFDFDFDTDIGVVRLPVARGGTGLITYTLTGLPSGLSFNAILRKITGTPDTEENAGATVTLTAIDETGTTVAQTFKAFVLKPLVLHSLARELLSNSSINLLLPAATGGKLPYTYSLSNLPTWASFDASTRRLTGTITSSAIMVYTVTDAEGNSISIDVTLRTYDPLTLSQPALQITLSALENSSFNSRITFTLNSATGGSGSNRVYSLSTMSGINQHFNRNTRELSVWKTDINYQVGDEFSATYSVSDNLNLSTSTTLSIEIV